MVDAFITLTTAIHAYGEAERAGKYQNMCMNVLEHGWITNTPITIIFFNRKWPFTCSSICFEWVSLAKEWITAAAAATTQGILFFVHDVARSQLHVRECVCVGHKDNFLRIRWEVRVRTRQWWSFACLIDDGRRYQLGKFTGDQSISRQS